MKKVKKMAIGGMGGRRPSPNPGRPGPVNPNPPMVKPGGQPMMPPQGQPRPPPALAPNPGKPGPVNPGMGPKPMMGGMGMKKGGKISASSRADGCATKGKTKGRFV